MQIILHKESNYDFLVDFAIIMATLSSVTQEKVEKVD